MYPLLSTIIIVVVVVIVVVIVFNSLFNDIKAFDYDNDSDND